VDEVVQVAQSDATRLLFVAQVDKKYGFGHLKRTLSLMKELNKREGLSIQLYIDLSVVDEILRDLIDVEIGLKHCLSQLNQEHWSLIVVDMCESPSTLVKELMQHGQVVAIDEGGGGPKYLSLLNRLVTTYQERTERQA
jgi:spore coat polysaccharide biosynthesis predicted glycosyltransferase SpsG